MRMRVWKTLDDVLDDPKGCWALIGKGPGRVRFLKDGRYRMVVEYPKVGMVCIDLESDEFHEFVRELDRLLGRPA